MTSLESSKKARQILKDRTFDQESKIEQFRAYSSIWLHDFHIYALTPIVARFLYDSLRICFEKHLAYKSTPIGLFHLPAKAQVARLQIGRLMTKDACEQRGAFT